MKTNTLALDKLFLPSFTGYKKRHLRADFIAALVVTAISVPESLAFAALIGLPVQTGLYCALLAPIVFALLTSSRRLIIGADSATAALLASGAGALAIVGTNEYLGVVTALSLIAGVLVVLLGVARFGFLSDLLSKPVLVGFIGGVGVQLMLGKLPEIFGLETSGTLLNKVGYILTHLPDFHAATLGLSLVVILAILIAPKLKIPEALAGLLVAIVAAMVFNMEDSGIKTIGTITEGLPSFVVPTWSLDLLFAIMPTALTIALVILAQSTAVTRTFASRHDEKVDDNKDLIALGFANIASVFSQGFSVNGSPPRSFAAEMSGGRSQMVNIFMAVFIGLILLFASGLLELIPVAALAIIIAHIGLHLIDWKQLRNIYRTDKTEFLIAVIALLGVVLLGVRQGLFIAIIASLMERLRREYHPRDRILLRDQKVDEWAKKRIDPHHRFSSSPAGLVVYDFNGALFFENASYFSQRLLEVVGSAQERVQTVIVDAGSITNLDYTGAEEIRRCYKQLRADDIRLNFAHVSPGLRKLFDSHGITKLVGAQSIYATLNEAVRAHPTAKRSTIEMVKHLKLPPRSYVVIGGGVLETLKLRKTNDVDLVVNNQVFKSLEKSEKWDEYVQDDGKKVLSYGGYKVMKRWVGMDFKRIKKRAFSRDGVAFMDPRDLLDAKVKLGRKKDLSDVRLLRKYLNEHEE